MATRAEKRTRGTRAFLQGAANLESLGLLTLPVGGAGEGRR